MGNPACSKLVARPCDHKDAQRPQGLSRVLGEGMLAGGRQVAGGNEGRKGLSEEAKRSLGRGRGKEGSSWKVSWWETEHDEGMSKKGHK